MRKTVFVIFLLSAIGLLAYSNSFNAPFQFDDLRQIAENPMVRSLDNFAPIFHGHAVSRPPGSEYNNRRLVGYLTLALNYYFGGLDVTGYHVVNLVIHLINGFLVYFLISLTFGTPYFKGQLSARDGMQVATGDNPPSSPDSRFTIHDSRFLVALFAALLFVSHPVQTQAVTYVIQRFTSLAAMFYLLSIVSYIKGRLGQEGLQADRLQAAKDSTPPSSPLKVRGDRGRLWPIVWYLTSLLSAVLAMLTKEISFTLPVIIVLYEFLFFKSSLRKKLLFLLPVLVTMAIIPVSIMGTHKPLGELLSDLSAETRVQTNIPRWDYLMTQMRVITTYIRLLFLPFNQNLDYGYPVYHSLWEAPVILSALFLLSVFGVGVYLFWKSRQAYKPASLQGGKPDSNDSLFTLHVSRLIAFGIFWFFITLSVESSVIPIADVIFEHRMYLPSAGAFMAVSGAVFVIVRKLGSLRRGFQRKTVFAAAVVILLLTGATYARNSVWKDPVKLWQDVLLKSPRNARAYNNLGYLYLMRGQTDKSVGYFREALRILPNYANPHTNLGVAYYNEGWFDAAIKEFKRALALEPYGPDFAEDHHNLGIAYTRKGMLDEAIGEFRTALKLAPNDAGIYNDLGFAYRQKGLTGQAIQCFRKSLKLDPEYVFARLNLAAAYESEGRYAEAREQYDAARRPGRGR